MDNAAITRELGVIKLAMDSGSMDPILALPDSTIDRHSELEKSPFDIHAFVADQLGISRKAAKGINFGIVYGMGKKKLGRSLGWSAAEAAEYLGNYHGQFPEISSVQERIKAKLLERGFIFDSFGRRYYLPSSRAYVGLNRLIQGWAASAFKLGYVRMCDMYASSTFGGSGIHRITRRPMPEACKVLACIHDENMSEIHTSLDTRHTDWAIRTCMTAAHDLLVPLGSSSERSSIEHGNGSWDEAVEAHFEN
jgi:DNA polymerase I-like protein with 3'-5' exonuclease and polymerase domains